MTKSELVTQIEQAWNAIQAEVNQLSEVQLTGVRSADGWSVKDHLAHLAAWERSALAIVRGEPRHLALGVDERLYTNGDFEQLNEAIYERHRADAFEIILAEWADAHRQLLAALGPLSDADLQRPDTDFLPGEPGFPLFSRIVSNTIKHYAEHHTWFSSLLAQA